MGAILGFLSFWRGWWSLTLNFFQTKNFTFPIFLYVMVDTQVFWKKEFFEKKIQGHEVKVKVKNFVQRSRSPNLEKIENRRRISIIWLIPFPTTPNSLI